MKAVVYHGIGDVRLDSVPEPRLKGPEDAIVRITASAICGTDLHFVRGTVPGMKSGTILGHEALGIVEEVGKSVRNFRRGDRVIVPSTVGCGRCGYCRVGYFSQCDRANPAGPLGGTVFFGGPETNGGLDGLQAEYARIPYAAITLLKLPEQIDDDNAILMSDVLPTSYMAAIMAEIKPGNSVGIFGCGPVGQLAIACAQHLGAGRVFAIDCVPSRLAIARAHGAETINYQEEDPVEALHTLTGGSGPDRVIDAVGIDSAAPTSGPAKPSRSTAKEFEAELEAVAPKQSRKYKTGGAPSQVLRWCVESVAKGGTVSIIGVYPLTMKSFPIGMVMNRNLTVRAGNCDHRRYMPEMIELVRSGRVRPAEWITQTEPIQLAIDAYQAFASHQPGWVKVKLDPGTLQRTR
jgi:threonine dehydrogenase-like Zn-dependent dehydrogenase